MLKLENYNNLSKEKAQTHLTSICRCAVLLTMGHSPVHRVTEAAEWRDGGVARERWGSLKGRGVKEGGLFNVQPMSKWDTIFFFLRKKGEEGWRWQCVWGWWGGLEDEGRKCRWELWLSVERRQEERGFRDKYFNINLSPPPLQNLHTHTLPFSPLAILDRVDTIDQSNGLCHKIPSQQHRPTNMTSLPQFSICLSCRLWS